MFYPRIFIFFGSSAKNAEFSIFFVQIVFWREKGRGSEGRETRSKMNPKVLFSSISNKFASFAKISDRKLFYRKQKPLFSSSFGHENPKEEREKE
jgi:hypothetical protein